MENCRVLWRSLRGNGEKLHGEGSIWTGPLEDGLNFNSFQGDISGTGNKAGKACVCRGPRSFQSNEKPLLSAGPETPLTVASWRTHRGRVQIGNTFAAASLFRNSISYKKEPQCAGLKTLTWHRSSTPSTGWKKIGTSPNISRLILYFFWFSNCLRQEVSLLL